MKYFDGADDPLEMPDGMTPTPDVIAQMSDDLRKLGFELFGLPDIPESKRVKYADYIESETWMARRQVALERDKHRCVSCNSPDRLQVHHRTYERLGDEYPEDIYTFCDTCHARLHDPEGD